MLRNLDILSGLVFVKTSTSFSLCKTEIETAINITVINIKIKIAICLRIPSRKISNHTEDSPRICFANR